MKSNKTKMKKAIEIKKVVKLLKLKCIFLRNILVALYFTVCVLTCNYLKSTVYKVKARSRGRFRVST